MKFDMQSSRPVPKAKLEWPRHLLLPSIEELRKQSEPDVEMVNRMFDEAAYLGVDE